MKGSREWLSRPEMDALSSKKITKADRPRGKKPQQTEVR
jgi:hypothetical protein